MIASHETVDGGGAAADQAATPTSAASAGMIRAAIRTGPVTITPERLRAFRK
jgi:hypothetical protein